MDYIDTVSEDDIINTLKKFDKERRLIDEINPENEPGIIIRNGSFRGLYVIKKPNFINKLFIRLIGWEWRPIKNG